MGQWPIFLHPGVKKLTRLRRNFDSLPLLHYTRLYAICQAFYFGLEFAIAIFVPSDAQRELARLLHKNFWHDYCIKTFGTIIA